MDVGFYPPELLFVRSKKFDFLEIAVRYDALDHCRVKPSNQLQFELCFCSDARPFKFCFVVSISRELARQYFKLLLEIGARDAPGQSVAKSVLTGGFSAGS
jgi:hypothetical protein